MTPKKHAPKKTGHTRPQIRHWRDGPETRGITLEDCVDRWGEIDPETGAFLKHGEVQP